MADLFSAAEGARLTFERPVPRFLGQWDTREKASPIFSSLVLNRHMSSGHKNDLKQPSHEWKNTQEEFLDF